MLRYEDSFEVEGLGCRVRHSRVWEQMCRCDDSFEVQG